MNLIKKIKFNYLSKLIIDHITNKNIEKASEELEKLKDNDLLVFYSVLKSINHHLQDTSNTNLHKKKIIWTISYDYLDQKYLNNFLNFYFKNNYTKHFYSDNFSDAASNFLSSFDGHGFPNEIKFEETIQNIGLFQNLILFSRSEDLFIFDTCAAFFESKSNNYLIYPNTTLCYFYIVKDPKELFLRYKNITGTTEEAYNELFNFTKKLHLSENQKRNLFKFFENKTSYNTNVNSWSDPNVLSTYKGKIIYFQDLEDNTEEVLIDVIQHLKQYYSDIEVDYNTIKKYVSINKLEKDKSSDLSKTEKKFLSRNLHLKNIDYKDTVIDY
tara:strand:+ start:88 stop:1068 length:981 start_codon:yes stop_codon:yes gene_type:complete